jgi:hypothetical protein
MPKEEAALVRSGKGSARIPADESILDDLMRVRERNQKGVARRDT